MIRKLRVKTVRFIRKNKEVFFINIIIKIYFGILKLLPKNIYFRILTFYKCKRKLEYIKLKFFRRKTEEIILKVDKTKLYFPDVGNAFMFINEQETFDIYKIGRFLHHKKGLKLLDVKYKETNSNIFIDVTDTGITKEILTINVKEPLNIRIMKRCVI